MAPSVSPLPPCAWQHPIAEGWPHAYIVRYASNLDDGPAHGAPLGGFGAGCLGRSPAGSFNLWHLDGGEHTFGAIPACQFSVFEQQGDDRRAYTLSPAEPPGFGSEVTAALPTWDRYPGGGTYSALYPRSAYVYEGTFAASLTCEQFSPIWAGNYQESSYPVAVFLWTVANPTDAPLTLSLLLSWQNLVGWFTNTAKSTAVLQRDDGSPYYDYVPALGQSTGNWNGLQIQAGAMDGGEVGTIAAVMAGPQAMGAPEEGAGQWAIATPWGGDGLEVFHHTRWNPGGDGADLWHPFAEDGSLANIQDDRPAAPGEQIGVALAVRFTLAPGEQRQIPFTLAWDLPVTEYRAGVKDFRRYTDFFGRGGDQAGAIARTALAHYPQWQQQIQQWQDPIVAHPQWPDWFKMALFNELYDLTSGGTLWTAATPTDPVGQFGVLECVDYRWYESLDVRLYGGFATLILWPELEKAILRAFARAIPTEDDRPRIIGYYTTMGSGPHYAPRKLRGATPHDLGAPNEHPFVQTNYTSYQDCNQWKDLPSDFVIQVYRAYRLTGETDVEFLADCWGAVTETLKYLKRFDTDGDGIPENGGAPDQTFDDWQLEGISAYCGGLWMAALESAIAIADVLTAAGCAPGNTPILVTQYQRWLEQSRRVYHKRLWNGRFYRLDTGSQSRVVMADQLCGQFCVQVVGLPDLVEAKYVRSTLAAIYDACFLKFTQYTATQAEPQNQKFAGAQVGNFRPTAAGQPIGAANGVLPDGSPEDPNSTHQLEVWTGITFGLATFYAQVGQTERAFALAEAVVRQVYSYGLQFRTPEAITALGTFRACHYLRPLAIWGLYGVLQGWQMPGAAESPSTSP